MKKIDLTKTITEIDGITPYAFGQQQMQDADGRPKQAIITSTFKILISRALRGVTTQPKRGDGGEILSKKDEVLKHVAFTKKVIECDKNTEWTQEEINTFDWILQQQTDVVYAQFLKEIE
jgi:hypothetical protein